MITDYKIIDGLPASHRWKKTSLRDKVLKGILWDSKDIQRKNNIILYKKWSSVHFESDWYEISTKPISEEIATNRDIKLLKKMFKDKLTPGINIIDVHCGSGRHLIKLTEEGIFGVGLEGSSVLRKMGQEKIKKNKLPIKIVPITNYFKNKYIEKADIITSLFNRATHSIREKMLQGCVG